MNTQHAKSPCCREKVIKFGSRRKKCKGCGKTWRIRKKKRGRKRKRESGQLVIKYLNQEIPTLYRLAKKQRSSERKLKLRLRRSLRSFLFSTPWPEVPKRGPLVAVADGMIQVIDGQAYTFYLVLLKTVHGKTAMIVPPRMALGGETLEMWHRVFCALSFGVWERIVALVCDGRPGLVSTGAYFGWPVQLCHFHLRRRLANYLRTGPQAKQRQLAQKLNRLIDIVLLSKRNHSVQTALKTLTAIYPEIQSQGVRRVLSGFLKNYPRYRTYLEYPKLNLPTTSNSAESVIERIRNLQYRARGFKSISSLTSWVHAILKHKQSIRCNGHLPTKFRY